MNLKNFYQEYAQNAKTQNSVFQQKLNSQG